MRSKAAVVGSLQTRNKPDISSIAAILVVAMVILSMIPLYAIARYDVPSADDFQFRPDVIQEIITNNGILDCIQYILEVVKYYYNNWQGTYTVYFIVNFLMMLGFEPPDMYSLVPIVILSLFTIAFFAICWVVLHGCLKISAKGTIIIFGLLQFACVQCTPSIVEGFYWYSGAMMYTGFFRLTLCLPRIGDDIVAKCRKAKILHSKNCNSNTCSICSWWNKLSHGAAQCTGICTYPGSLAV